MPNKRKDDYTPQASPEKAQACHIAGCREPGLYKAPLSRDALGEYRWFCLNHVREHNATWDFFSGMDSSQIESFIKDAVTGHRPTWDRESRRRDHHKHLQDALYEFMHPGARPAPKTPPLSAKLRKALATMDLEYPCTARQLKVQYRAMVKKFHPDMNKGDKKSEERFKQITAAYQALTEHIKNL